MQSEELIQAVLVTAELCGRTFTPQSAAVFVQDISDFPEAQVLGALKKCRREIRGILTVADVIARLDDGRPGPEEAWGMLPRDESATIVWTQEMAEAFGAARHLMDEDRVAARMTFKEVYVRLCAEAREARRPCEWTASLGHDPKCRRDALKQAADKGLVSLEYVERCTPLIEAPVSDIVGLLEMAVTRKPPEDVRARLADIRARVALPVPKPTHQQEQ